MSEKFLTIAEVAENLQLSAQAVRALILSGDLPAIQVGARHLWRVPESAFDGYVERQLEATRTMVAAGQRSTQE
ncbi:helix-turn-helix domain-containing protein [Actinomyces radicidentis]|uniref:helix-turn-helix domain-containing protein n=1 Tax=Actinomyces radicidentis TaxID=111015 RepID=UPI0026E02815|nr:helix-turn-helix domain-containing protein [Actinomyces radicidentis]